MRKIRVLQIVSGIAIGDQSGGAESFALRLARQLDKAKFEAGIFAIWRHNSPAEKEWIQLLEREQISLAGLTNPPSYRSIDFYQNFTALKNFVSRFEPDIINSHSDRGDLLNVLTKLTHPIHPKAVRTIHIDQFWRSRPYLEVFINQIFFPLTFDLEIAISSTIHEIIDSRYLSRLLNRRSVLCYNGIDAGIFTLQDRKKTTLDSLSIPQGYPLLGVIGRLTEQKGHTDLFRAMYLVHQSLPVFLLVIGSGPLESTLRDLAHEYSLEDHIRFLGSRNDVLDILPCLDLLVSSSLWEGFPTVLLEAMALGIPVVATEVSGSKELVLNNQTGLLVQPQNPSQLAEAIVFMLTHPNESQSMANRAKRFASQFTIQKTADMYSSIYTEMFQKSSSK